MTTPAMTMQDVGMVEHGQMSLYVLSLPALELAGQIGEAQEVLAIPIFSRLDGLLMAIPGSALPPELAEPSTMIGADALIGPVRFVTMDLTSSDETDAPIGLVAEIALVDFHSSVLPRMRPFDPATEGPGILCFWPEDVDMVPGSQALMTTALKWIEENKEGGRMLFYSAAEEEAVPETPLPVRGTTSPAQQTPKRRSAAPKKITTATLSEQLSGLAMAIPAISNQLQEMQTRQTRVEALLATPQAQAQRPAHLRRALAL